MQTLLQTPNASRAHWGISVVDAATGAPLYALNDGLLFQPASNAKLFTTAAALALLGPDRTLETRVVADGEVTPDGTLHGNLRLIGAGDPSISGRAYPYAGRTERPAPPLHGLDELAAQVAARGIRAVTGSVVGDDTLLPYEPYASGWAWDDFQWEYGAAVSALTVSDNVHYLKVTPGARAGDPVVAAWDPAPGALPGAPPPAAYAAQQAAGGEGLSVTARTTAGGSEAHLGVSRDAEPPGNPLRLYGTLPAGSKPMGIAIAVRDPAAFAASALRASLLAHGVQVGGQAAASHRLSLDTTSFPVETHLPLGLRPLADTPQPPASDRVVATHTSPPLRELAVVTNKVSQNLHAELFLHLLGKAQGDDGSTAQGIRVVRQFLVSAGVDPMDFTFADGSGLSSLDLVTPRAVTALLVYASKQSWGADYRASLPVGGVDGSLAGRFTQPPLKGRVVAKTGTLSQVNALSGYLIADSGRVVAFSILCNDAVGEGGRSTLDRVVAAIAGAL